MPKFRADQLLHEQGLAESREKAKRLIMAGKVRVRINGVERPVDKPGQPLPPEAELLSDAPERFVSRGGYKLLTAIEHFGIRPEGKICLDAGASTGGFTDCLLQHGASRVHAVDVGYGQLDSKLRNDPRVVNIERTNLRTAPPELIQETIDLVVADCSFISLRLILPPCLSWLRPGGEIIALVKPQFELGPGATDKGVVRSEEKQLEAVRQVIEFSETTLGLTCHGHVPSVIRGPKGNQEYLVHFTAGG